jgi:Rrf2 family nitric oxide-sensitive transcriptional repressor
MQLTAHTDYAFRTLIALAAVAPEKLTAAEISNSYQISQAHLQKVVQKLAELGFVTTSRGRSGGIRLAVEPKALRLGAIVRGLEPELGLVACLRSGDTPCAITPACGLKSILRDAMAQFLSVLDEHTLADAIASKGRVAQLLQLHARG